MATALENVVQRARDNGISSRGADTLNQLVREFRDVWAIKLGPGAPADVPPVFMQLNPNARQRRRPSDAGLLPPLRFWQRLLGIWRRLVRL
jgi:hypothetical protein